ncbi:hypothetical protein BHM03_00024933 [Ensete ventricosum]|uniref:Putative gamma-glutamylcyclotransferase n=1 Tax=Ensete ventricosum TaxID=4639 RepID=A0A427B5B1_ENSVE|nr:hypothetical protein B296_00016157 [Ensete ventricosum]RZR96010.1 hypothetical protein BHM03_00024933 [Ensete ventricosum]
MAATANASSFHNVFVYGTLMADEVVRTILKRVPPASPAVLNDYHRFSIKGRVYPAILPVESKKVTGRVCPLTLLYLMLVLLEITDQELDKLDSFEDVEYERRTVEISLLDKSEKLVANAYVWSDKSDPNLYGEWDFEINKVRIFSFLQPFKQLMKRLHSDRSINILTLERSCIVQEWKCLHKKDFVAMTLGFMDDMEQPDSKTRVATYDSYFHQGQSA